MGRVNKELVSSNKEAHLRAISWRDSDVITRLNRAAFPEMSLRQLARLFTDRPNIVVLDVEGTAAGYCYIYNRSLRECWLDWLLIDSRYRSCGYGYLLLKTVEGIAVARKCRTIKLAVIRDNPRAISFYKRHGFKQCGEDKLKIHLMKPLDFVTPHLPTWLPKHSHNRLMQGWYQLWLWMVVHNIR